MYLQMCFLNLKFNAWNLIEQVKKCNDDWKVEWSIIKVLLTLKGWLTNRKVIAKHQLDVREGEGLTPWRLPYQSTRSTLIVLKKRNKLFIQSGKSYNRGILQSRHDIPRLQTIEKSHSLMLIRYDVINQYKPIMLQYQRLLRKFRSVKI